MTTETTETLVDPALEKAAVLENPDLTALQQERDTLKADLEKASEVAKKAADLQAAYDALVEEKTKLATDFDGLKSTIKTEKVTSTLLTALEAAGVKAAQTALKLMDTTKIEFDEAGQIIQDSVIAAVEAIKTSDPFLFGVAGEKNSQGGPTPPTVKVAASGMTQQSAFETELASAKSQKDVERIVAKYNIRN
jgi:hypothetical protein